MLHTYIFNALDDFTIFVISFTNKGGIILVYRLPGPTIITSALDKEFFALSEPFAFEGIKLISLIFPFLSGINDSPNTFVPSSNIACKVILSSEAGRTLPLAPNILADKLMKKHCIQDVDFAYRLAKDMMKMETNIQLGQMGVIISTQIIISLFLIQLFILRSCIKLEFKR